ncbi:non-ribosomal peptide synthetase [Lentzea kentuckyensis]|uniref:non-ribosomal peptide synthetase n=1 Tax=Lentzea kentuckyensis TaxID=360086 RepID=UPI0013021B73|nr:non-ribosomal peptide synthetase [Lentzea kentuckyensis]
MKPCLHDLVAEQAARTPEAVAVVCGETRLSYRDLVEKANRLAHRLRAEGAGQETVVAVSVPRSPELLIAVLGVLTAGAAYLPLNPDEPAARRELILADAEVLLVVTEEWPAGLDGPATRPDVAVSQENLAYVIYTSGSTGTPKGVQVQHDTAVNYVEWCASTYDVTAGSGAPLHSPVAYDLSVTSLFTPLVAGRAVTVLPEGATPLTPLAEALPGNNFSFVKLTPSHLTALAEMLPRGSAAARRLVVGGEALTGEVLRSWAPDTVVVNEYGPTEATVACCAKEFRAGDVADGPVPIGDGIAGARLHVLDENLEESETGELYVGGTPVSRGYLGRPGATAAAFVPDPFGEVPGARLYRTGDLVSRTADGLVYLGRADDEVKIRGYRVHPAEIESALCSHDRVTSAAVLTEPHLIAYVTGEPDALLRDHLAERLPPHMVPAEIQWLPSLPLTPGGKVDRARLPQPSGEAAEKPRTPTEAAVARVFEELLGTPPVRLDRNFLALGGDSVRAAQLMARLSRTYHVDIPMDLWHMAPTVTGLALLIDTYVRDGRDAAIALHEQSDLDEVLLDDEILAALETGGTHATR